MNVPSKIERVMDLEPVMSWHRYFDPLNFVQERHLWDGCNEPVPQKIRMEKSKRRPSRTEDHFQPVFELRLSLSITASRNIPFCPLRWVAGGGGGRRRLIRLPCRSGG